jgi:hypothetical protein
VLDRFARYCEVVQLGRRPRGGAETNRSPVGLLGSRQYSGLAPNSGDLAAIGAIR